MKNHPFSAKNKEKYQELMRIKENFALVQELNKNAQKLLATVFLDFYKWCEKYKINP